ENRACEEEGNQCGGDLCDAKKKPARDRPHGRSLMREVRRSRSRARNRAMRSPSSISTSSARTGWTSRSRRREGATPSPEADCPGHRKDQEQDRRNLAGASSPSCRSALARIDEELAAFLPLTRR